MEIPGISVDDVIRRLVPCSRIDGEYPVASGQWPVATTRSSRLGLLSSQRSIRVTHIYRMILACSSHQCW